MKIFSINLFYIIVFLIGMSLIYILGILLININHGFDITDESFYILSILYPNEVYSSAITLFRYPLFLVNQLTGENLPIFRATGILFLFISALWLGYELQRYLKEKFSFEMTKLEIISFIIVISLGVFSTYRNWHLTPSYNWLATWSIIVYYAMILKLTVDKNKTLLKYIMVGFFLALAFVAKPTTSVLLVLIGLLFLIFEYKRFKILSLFSTISMSTIIFLVLIVFVSYGDFGNYINAIKENLEIMKILGGGHSYQEQVSNIINTFQVYYFEKLLIVKKTSHLSIVVLFSLFLGSLFYFRNHHKKKQVYFCLSIVILGIYTLILLGYLIRINMQLSVAWFYLVEYGLINIIIISSYLIISDDKKQFLKFLMGLLFLCFIFILGSFSYALGSNNNLILKMSKSLIFVYMAIMSCSLIFSKKSNNNSFYYISIVVLSVFMLILINKAYSFPYRQITSIEQQAHPVKFLNQDFTVKVDQKTKQYIEDLKQIAQKNGITESVYLIDMTGGTPGSHLIINTKFFDRPWLMGGYPGSDEFAFKVLKKYKEKESFKKAWVLTAPDGRLKLNEAVLNKLGLNFPRNYTKIGTVTSGYRNEKQYLWKPNY